MLTFDPSCWQLSSSHIGHAMITGRAQHWSGFKIKIPLLTGIPAHVPALHEAYVSPPRPTPSSPEAPLRVASRKCGSSSLRTVYARIDQAGAGPTAMLLRAWHACSPLIPLD